jgi:hypothetical protein
MPSRGSLVAASAALALLIVLIFIATWNYGGGSRVLSPDIARDSPRAPDEDAGVWGVDNSATDTPELNTARDEGGKDEPRDTSVSEPKDAADGPHANDPKRSTGEKRLSPRNPPDWEEVKRMPIGSPRVPPRATYSSNLLGGWHVVDTTPKVAQRSTGSHPDFGRGHEDPSKLVRGCVFEILGAERIPLAGVLVHTGVRARTFTDAEGRFELLANYEESSKDGTAFEVYLQAMAPGYIDLRGGDWYGSTEQGEDGFELYLAPRDSQRITIRFDNPQAAGGLVTVILSYDVRESVNWDERRYIVALVDPHMEAWFTVPVAYYKAMNETTFRLRSASAPNVLMDAASLKPISSTDEEIVFSVTLVAEDTITVTGTAVDMQTGKPVPHARISGPGYTEFAVGDERGEFEIALSKTPRDARGDLVIDKHIMTVADEGYATMQAQVDTTTLIADETGGLVIGPGGDLAGPWTFRLRRWVSATVDCGFLSAEQRSGATLRVDYNLIDATFGERAAHPVDANGVCEFPRIPWGLETLRLYTSSPKTRSQKLNLPADVWNGAGPYLLQPDNQD